MTKGTKLASAVGVVALAGVIGVLYATGLWYTHHRPAPTSADARLAAQLSDFAARSLNRRFTTGQQVVATQAPTASALLVASAPTLGPADAPITVVEFADFQCPYCREEFPIIRELMTRYPALIRYQFRHFPLTDLHPLARSAAIAGYCANVQGKFWPFHDLIYANQNDMSEERIASIASTIGIASQEFASCRASTAAAKAVDDDIATGRSLGVAGTPTFFINGQKVEGAIPADTWQQVVAALTGAKN